MIILLESMIRMFITLAELIVLIPMYATLFSDFNLEIAFLKLFERIEQLFNDIRGYVVPDCIEVLKSIQVYVFFI